ncbi:hypothetical protein [Psychrobacter sp. ANT_WB68]|uniref:hypothetical protein n=1 Tax=Psychrobacter sp. ANT_WB68 TaxID=2597355 RepID=UPI0011F16F33|nr:hypothetical protein [Psychrobacter sp. ANT_WB68]KAA0914471.1 hypothetical protein FQ084_07845 [Psychrobacter sp. ANT_WB68]
MKKLNVALSIIKKPEKMSVLSSKSMITVSTLVASTLLITGCQSVNLSQSKNLPADNTPSVAKAALATALQQQRRQSFAYHSNVEIVNEQQFTTIDSTQLVTSEYVDSYCEDNHDQAYAALLTKSEAQNKAITSIDYEPQRHALKQSYLACVDAYEAWRDAHYDSDAYSVDVAAEDVVDAVAEMAPIASEMDSASDASVTTASVSPYYEKLFNEYESKTSKLDIKKSQLLDAYLLKPLSMNVQGVYQPLAGKFTMLGSVQYSARNHRTSINQPIYVDFKTGSLYLWADNFALLTSKLADDKLGTKWKNKWLKIALDDGTLPKDFGRAVIKSHIQAEDSVYAKADVSQFDFIAPNILTALSPKLPEQQLVPMLNSEKIIRRVQSSASDEQAYKDYMGTFYKLITQQYPELITQSVSDTQDDIYPADNKITSKSIVKQVLLKMKGFADDKVLKTQETTLPISRSNLPVQELYGFSKGGQLQWQHSRHYLPTKASNDATEKNSLVIDALTQYMSIRAQDKAFPNLASDSQVPNASNSIDLKEYSIELAEYYRQGNGTTMGKMLFSMLPMYKQRLGSMD